MDINKVFGNNVKKYRLKIGMTQRELAAKTGLHRTYIYAVESNKRSASIKTAEIIAEALGVELYVLFMTDGNRQD